jgi:hypothetical protein
LRYNNIIARLHIMRAAPISVVFKQAKVLNHAIDRRGRYGAAKLAELLDWQTTDIARYLGRAPSTISRFGASQVHQEKLAVLASLVQDVFGLAENSLRATRAWFRTPLGTLDGISPREEILRGNFWRVRRIVSEMESGFAF